MADWRVVLRGTMLGQTVNAQRFWSTPSTTPDFQAFADALGISLASSLAPITPSVLVWTELYIIQAQPGGIGLSFVPANFPLAGADAGGQYLPPHVAILLVYNGEFVRHPRQGRNRLPGLLENQVTGGQLTPAAQTAWEAVANSLSQTYITADNWTPILWSDEYLQTNTIASRQVRAQLPTQNSRKIGAGT